MNNEKTNKFKSDFWFTRLRDLLNEDISKDRRKFMKIAVFWFVLIEYEGYTEEEVTRVLANDGFKSQKLIEDYKIDDLAMFVDKVNYIASTNMIKTFIELIKASNVSDKDKEKLIHDLLEKDIIEAW